MVELNNPIFSSFVNAHLLSPGRRFSYFSKETILPNNREDNRRNRVICNIKQLDMNRLGLCFWYLSNCLKPSYHVEPSVDSTLHSITVVGMPLMNNTISGLMCFSPSIKPLVMVCLNWLDTVKRLFSILSVSINWIVIAFSDGLGLKDFSPLSHFENFSLSSIL